MIANYVVPFSVNNLQVSIRTQVAFAREYCKNNKIRFSLPTTESWYSGEYSKLKDLVAGGYTDILVYSKILLASELCYETLLECQKRGEGNMPRFHITYSNKMVDTTTMLKDINEKLRHKRHSMKLNIVLEYLKSNLVREPANL